MTKEKYRKDITNERFGRLVALYKIGKTKTGLGIWHCKCDCGNEIDVSRGYLVAKNGRKSCGCLQKEQRESHNMCYTRIYGIWCAINTRCNNKNSPAYKNYGGRGIKCLWSSFENFKEDMYESYLDHVTEFGENQTTLDRIDVNGNYCKENCRWTTMEEQCSNKRNNRFILFDGGIYTAMRLSKKLSIPYTTIISRLNNGFYVEYFGGDIE